MTKQEQLKNSIDSMNKHSGSFSGSRYNEWVLLLLTSIADSLATIADSLADTEEEVD